MTTIYIMDISKLNQDEVFERYFARVSLWRRQKIERAKFRMDKNRSLGAAILLAHGLLPYGISERDALICRGEYGKPYISAVLKDGREEEVRGIHFNLSHSGTYVAAAFGDVRVGIDIEHIRENWKKIAEHFFSEEEVRNIMSPKRGGKTGLVFALLDDKGERDESERGGNADPSARYFSERKR